MNTSLQINKQRSLENVAVHRKQGQMISGSTKVKNVQELSRKLAFQMHPESLKETATYQGDLHRFGRQI